MTNLYDEPHRILQDRFDTRRLADRLEESLLHDALTESEKQFIESRDMFFLATVDAQGHANCSYRGGDPGFVRVVDEHTIAFPNYDGNGMYLSMGNVLDARQVGILFIDFENPQRMRFNGEASIDFDDPLRDSFPEAQFVVRVRAREIFTNCPRYIHRMKLIERSRFVPKSGCVTPVPAWKAGDWVADDLPAADPARDTSREVL
jgi:predicted pyridoxine 5'-phosphate oxidase superfamily flavin-nucleotide-binding protein